MKKREKQRIRLLERLKVGDVYHGAKIIKIYFGKSPYYKNRKPSYRVRFIIDGKEKDLSIYSFHNYYMFNDTPY